MSRLSYGNISMMINNKPFVLSRLSLEMARFSSFHTYEFEGLYRCGYRFGDTTYCLQKYMGHQFNRILIPGNFLTKNQF